MPPSHQTFGVTELPCCHDVTPNMKLTVSPSVLRDLQLKGKPPFQAVPCCSVLICTTQGKGGLKCREVSVHLYERTLVAFQCETPCQESSFLTSHPGFPFSNLARPVLCHVSAPANGQGEVVAVPLRWDFSSHSSQEMD